jgi:hypothetical protein
VAIISMAQQASPNATGHSEERRAQFTIPSTDPRRMFFRTDSSMGSKASVTLIRPVLSAVEGPVLSGAEGLSSISVSTGELYHKVVGKKEIGSWRLEVRG